MTMLTWQNTKHLLAEYDGTATEIFVIGLPVSSLSTVIAALAGLPALEVLSFDGKEFYQPEPFDTDWCLRFKTTPSYSCLRSLGSATGTPQHLQIYLRFDLKAITLEVEIVFWNDITFPKNLSPEEREQRLEDLSSLAEACRNGVPDARCILAAEHNGPVKELLELESTVIW